MKKNYQTTTTRAATTVEAQVPDAVSVRLAELAGQLREGLLALAVGAGRTAREHAVTILDLLVPALQELRPRESG
jgi:hypothetical protein